MKFAHGSNRLPCLLAILLAAVVLMSGSASAQVLYGTVVGTVLDQSGAVIPNVKITITDKDTGLSRDVMSDEAGRYTIGNLLPSTYELKATTQGFRTLTRTDVEVSVNTVTRADLKMEVGAIAEQVTVEGQAVI